MIFKDLNFTMNKYTKFYGKKIKIIFNNENDYDLIGYFECINLPYDYINYYEADNITVSIRRQIQKENPTHNPIHVITADLIENVLIDNTTEILFKISIVKHKLISLLNYDCFYHISSFIQEEFINI